MMSDDELDDPDADLLASAGGHALRSAHASTADDELSTSDETDDERVPVTRAARREQVGMRACACASAPRLTCGCVCAVVAAFVRLIDRAICRAFAS